jgi:hypothetical protein
MSRASSPAKRISAIDFTGDIPAASTTDYTYGLGFGATIGYDVQARWALVATFTSEGIAKIPLRGNDGSFANEPEDVTARSLTAGIAYRF